MKRIPLKALLLLQTAYCFGGILYNLGSLYAQGNGQAAWSPTPPLTGIAALVLYGLFLSAGWWKKATLYRALMGAAVLGLGYGGVVKHLLNAGQLDLYHSGWTWAAAVGINTYGLALNVMAAAGGFDAKGPFGARQ